MKIELIEEKKVGTGTMYVLVVDGSDKKWFAQKEKAEEFYNEVIANPNRLNEERNILQSHEIEVSLPLSNQ